MEVQGEFKMQAHITSSVVVDIAAFKVSHCVVSDIDATTLQAKKARSASMGRWMICHRRFKMQTLTYCNAKVVSTRTAVGQFKGQFKGAMDEMSRKVQNASSHILRRQSHEHAHSSRSVQGPVQGGDG